MNPTVSLSVYRGQAEEGIGEGPGYPISRGEQYLKGTSPELAKDVKLLTAIRPWLTLDSRPQDHRYKPESWSCFFYENWMFVVRLMVAGIFDDRVAYFSHARAWSLDNCRGEFDPGVYLGCSSVFDMPSDMGGSAAELQKLLPEVLPAQWLVQLKSEKEVAVRFLGHLLQALEQDYPLLLSVPVGEFATGKPLHTLVSFARAALPVDLKSRCTIRLYTTYDPTQLFEKWKTNLIAVPEDIDREVLNKAFSEELNPTLLDYKGNVKAGQSLQIKAEKYARKIIKGVQQQPKGLLPFSARFGPLHAKGLLTDEDLRPVQISYDLALAMMGTKEDFNDSFWWDYLRAEAANAVNLPWELLLDDQDWSWFSPQRLREYILQNPDELSAGEQILQNATTAALVRLRLTLDECLPVWWKDDDWQLRRLSQLRIRAPSLLSPLSIAERTVSIPLTRLKVLTPLHGLLEAEFEAGVLGQRSRESSLLAELAAADPDIDKIVEEAVKIGQLKWIWMLENIDNLDAEKLFKKARSLVKNWEGWPHWDIIFAKVLDRLRDQLHECKSIPDDLIQLLRQVGQSLDFLKNWEIYIRLADLLAPADQYSGAIAPSNFLMQRLWQYRKQLDSNMTYDLVDIALNECWWCLAPASLVLSNGELALSQFDDKVSKRLLSSTEILKRLNADALLNLFCKLHRQLDNKQIRQVYSEITDKMQLNMKATLHALIVRDLWYSWRFQADGELTESQYREVAVAWLQFSLRWNDKSLNVSQKTWQQVRTDLELGLTGLQIQELLVRDNSRELSDQYNIDFIRKHFYKICGLAVDFGALAELIEFINFVSGPYTSDNIIKITETSYQNSMMASQGQSFAFPSNALLYLLRSPPEQSLPALSLEQSLYLYKYAGHRQREALRARMKSVIECFSKDSLKALYAVDNPNLWEYQDFLYELRGLFKKITFDKKLLVELDNKINPNWLAKLPPSRQVDMRNEAKSIAKDGYKNIAEFLWFGICSEVSREELPKKILESLCQNDSDNQCWVEIETATDNFNVEQQNQFIHPLCSLSVIIYEQNLPEQCGLKYWSCFEEAARKHSKLLGYISCPQFYLPAFNFVASLFGNGRLAEAAQRIIIIAGPYWDNLIWWQALLYSVRNCRRQNGIRSVDDRIDIAHNQIYSCAKRFLNKKAQEKLAEAFQLDADIYYSKTLKISECRLEIR